MTNKTPPPPGAAAERAGEAVVSEAARDFAALHPDDVIAWLIPADPCKADRFVTLSHALAAKYPDAIPLFASPAPAQVYAEADTAHATVALREWMEYEKAHCLRYGNEKPVPEVVAARKWLERIADGGVRQGAVTHDRSDDFSRCRSLAARREDRACDAAVLHGCDRRRRGEGMSETTSVSPQTCFFCGGGPGWHYAGCSSYSWRQTIQVGQTGWICPLCGGGVSPLATRCDCKDTIPMSGGKP